jgi:hypothetical protein
MFSPVRVVCQNTLSQAIGIAANGDQAHRVKIRHTLNADQLIKNIPQLIDVQRRQFTGGVAELKAMAAQPCPMAEFRAYVSAVFADQLAGTINAERGNPASARPKVLDDLPQWEILSRKFDGAAIGASIPGVSGTVWGAYNAITEFLTHDAGKTKTDNNALDLVIPHALVFVYPVKYLFDACHIKRFLGPRFGVAIKLFYSRFVTQDCTTFLQSMQAVSF